MIKSFRSKALKLCWDNDDCMKLPPAMLNKIRWLLQAIDSAQIVPDELSYCDIHSLKGNYKDHWSVKVNRNYRIVFIFMKGHAYDVDYIDYH
ncbi:type II toxin-antitoxin system RelE/ParE family toxin [Chitinophaga sp. GCM10012297]|uniref:Type II toxin-antitoxin system RelE/ParE family toxin n=1 Tax=Chitinophaga chungangae TaxID=2821488 RepID=A0ABS3Y8V3_9BACT|nr:type II toxin-antitoxin system RelE/ParE family toxin [Chitinophaga chungangae]MBO9151113.1 type II toxin-antitoxin system RelE/ParE family toxin [Chitinophaga chungangae]